MLWFISFPRFRNIQRQFAADRPVALWSWCDSDFPTSSFHLFAFNPFALPLANRTIKFELERFQQIPTAGYQEYHQPIPPIFPNLTNAPIHKRITAAERATSKYPATQALKTFTELNPQHLELKPQRSSPVGHLEAGVAQVKWKGRDHSTAASATCLKADPDKRIIGHLVATPTTSATNTHHFYTMTTAPI